MSRVIKPHFYVALDNKKMIEAVESPLPNPAVSPASADDGLTEQDRQDLDQIREMKEQILSDAESVAESQIRSAMDEAAAIREQAQAQIDEWWQERRNLDQQVEDQVRQTGYEAGYQEGVQQAEEQVRQHYEGLLNEAKSVLELAYEMKRQIIKESEPFLIELATAISEKIIRQELNSNPEWVIGMTRSVLSRKREKGVVTLCVAPEHFAYIRDARDELELAVDSQAELQILPDSSVGDHGCVVRTAFGSIDARVDTQLKEIKQALQQISMEPVEGADEE